MTCAKRVVKCFLNAPHQRHLGYIPHGSEILQVAGVNSCDEPREVCPREPGEGYAKCAALCKQRGHAEMEALRLARELGVDVTGWSATIQGHYYVCEPCARALREAGITSIHIMG